LVACADGDSIFTISGLASGSQGTTATFQYAGNGSWVNLGQTFIATGAVGAPQIAAGAVGNAQLASNAVQAANIASGAVGSTQLSANAVQSSNLANGAVTSAHLSAGAMSAAQGVSGTSQQAAANTSYAVTGNSTATFFLPPSANAGDTV
jgi:hypothetical protein